MKRPIYLDYNATTPIDPLVLQAMNPYLESEFGNPDSLTHAYGWEPRMAVATARKQVAQLIGAREEEIFWTSGATESNNMSLLGYVRHRLQTQEGKKQGERLHIITSKVEHKAVLDVCQWLTRFDSIDIDFLDVNEYGQIDLDDLKRKIQDHTRLVSLIAANNEVGSLNPIKKIGEITKERGILFHTDAAQAVGKVPIDVESMNIDLLSISAHKIYGPKGCGVLYIRQKPLVELEPLMFGGGQEGGLRPGTLNVPGIVGLGKACELCYQQIDQEGERLSQLRNHLINSIKEAVPTARLNGHPKERLPNNASFSFHGLSADLFTLGLGGLACSSASACASGTPQTSHVLKAMGHNDALAKSTLRIGIGRFTTAEDIEVAIDKVVQMARKNESLSFK